MSNCLVDNAARCLTTASMCKTESALVVNGRECRICMTSANMLNGSEMVYKVHKRQLLYSTIQKAEIH